uniref:Uncharacterized protein n=1 Tax=Oryza meridionalis TaxID=40149 RepID=A0A0E0E033_9ORYZ
MARGMSRRRRFTLDERRWLDFFKGLPCMHVFRVREVHARLPWQGIGLGLTGEGEIEDGARRPELEKMMPISKIAAPLDGVLGGKWRGDRCEDDGMVARPAPVHCTRNGDDVKAATRRARSKAGNDTTAFPLIRCTREDGIKRKNLRHVKVSMEWW